MCEMAFCSGKLQQKTKLMCLRPLIFIKRKRRRIIAAKFATVIEELVATRIVCLLSSVIFSAQVLFARILFFTGYIY